MARLVVIVVFGVLACVQTAPEPHQLPRDMELENRNSSKTEIDLKMDDVPADTDVPSGKENVPIPDNKGLVSDVLDAAISGIQFGIELGATNGTLNKLCLKIGGVNLSGCRRTVDGDAKSEDVKEIPEVDVPTVVNN